MTDPDSVRVRQARPEDTEAVVAFTQDTWSEQGASDYMPDAFPRWVETDGPEQRTFVVDVNDGEDVAGVLQGVILSDTEAWAQGMRVDPAYRGHGLSPKLSRAVFEWAREQGAAVCRNMVFSWNVAGLGQSRAVGFDPATEFRYATPDPDPDAEPSLDITADPGAAWSFWTDSEARSALGGLSLDFGESWAVSELRKSEVEQAADDDRLFVVQDGGTRGFSLRGKTSEFEEDGEQIKRAVYAVGVWDTPEAAEAVLDAVKRDAAEIDADRVRVFVPEGVRWVSDVAAARCPVSDEPDFVMRADLTNSDLFTSSDR
ncbi:MAG: N-acetyltransferase family protein [Halobaculum sp.]